LGETPTSRLTASESAHPERKREREREAWPAKDPALLPHPSASGTHEIVELSMISPDFLETQEEDRVWISSMGRETLPSCCQVQQYLDE
jgi:hypothetical protein